MRDNWQYGSTVACMLNQRCGPSQWQLRPEFAACGEQGTQSPIDLAFATMDTPLTEMSLPNPLRLKDGHCNQGDFVLNEHTTEVMVDETCKDTYSLPFVSSTSNATEKTFHLYQFQYHSPSEHTLHGKYFPMEVHHVHHAKDGQALIIAVFVAVGTPQGAEEEQRAQFLLDMQTLMPQVDPSLHPSVTRGGNVWKRLVEGTPNLDVYSKFIDISGGYFYYDGSFTTPPCTPGTHWIILPKPVVVPQSTVDLYRKLINGNPNNQLAPCFESSAWHRRRRRRPFRRPPWHSAAGNVVWNASLGCNKRPIQPLQGVTDLGRQLYSVGNSRAVAEALRPEEGSGPNSGAMVSPWLYLGLAVLVGPALIGMAIFMCKNDKEKNMDNE